jgi:spore germination protein GerM
MSEPRRRPPSTDASRRRRRSQGGALRWPFWIVLLLLVAVSGWYLWRLGRESAPGFVELEDEALPTLEDQAAGDRAVILVFPEWDAAGYVSERRRIPSRGRSEEDLQALLNELCSGPGRSGAVSALPQRTRVLSAFLDRDGRAAVLDFSSELVVRHPGGSAAEAATLTSILRTVALNFPDLETCLILVDGDQVETLGGHLALDRPFDLRRWL